MKEYIMEEIKVPCGTDMDSKSIPTTINMMANGKETKNMEWEFLRMHQPEE
jgi:hypothetical protein